MSDISGLSERSAQAYERLDTALREYFQSVWSDLDKAEEGEYIENWVIVVNFGNMKTNAAASDYAFESSPYRMPPHAAKGPLREGIEAVEAVQYGEDSSD